MLPTDVAKQLPDIRRREIAPTIFPEEIAAEEITQPLIVTTAGKFNRSASEGTTVEFYVVSGVCEACLSLQREGTTERVQTKERIRAGHQINAGDRGLRNDIPVHRVTERFVNTNAVLISG